ncbi:MAG TPA: BatD family protein, partial [Myxococcota bacterium]|nr:BatD family protein [Myxococcota bacterium]
MAPALVLAALLVPAAAFAQSVEATVDRDRIGAGETVTLSIVLEGNFDDTTGPEMPDFEVVGRSTGSSVSIVNGKVSRQQQVVLRLAPRRAGALTIGPI